MKLTHALKEWSVVVDALLEGRQTLTIRKGGISEEDGVFRTDIPEFLLYPTFLHQDEQAIWPEERHRFGRIPPPPAGEVHFPGWAVVRDVVLVPDLAALSKLAPRTIWTDAYLERRFRMLAKLPLFALSLEVHRCDPLIVRPERPEWAGCKSYLEVIPPHRVNVTTLSPSSPPHTGKTSCSSGPVPLARDGR